MTGGFHHAAVVGWLNDHAEWNLDNKVYEINHHRVNESHRDTIHRWITKHKDPIPLGRWDEILLAHGVMLWEFEMEYPEAYVERSSHEAPMASQLS